MNKYVIFWAQKLTLWARESISNHVKTVSLLFSAQFQSNERIVMLAPRGVYCLPKIRSSPQQEKDLLNMSVLSNPASHEADVNSSGYISVIFTVLLKLFIPVFWLTFILVLYRCTVPALTHCTMCTLWNDLLYRTGVDKYNVITYTMDVLRYVCTCFPVFPLLPFE